MLLGSPPSAARRGPDHRTKKGRPVSGPPPFFKPQLRLEADADADGRRVRVDHVEVTTIFDLQVGSRGELVLVATAQVPIVVAFSEGVATGNEQLAVTELRTSAAGQAPNDVGAIDKNLVGRRFDTHERGLARVEVIAQRNAGYGFFVAA